MFKFGTISAFKHVRNNPRAKALVDLKNGNIVIPDDASGSAPTPANLGQAQGKNLWVAINIIDKPEINTLKTGWGIKAGEFVNAFSLADLAGLTVELDASVIATDYATISRGEKLVAQGNGSGQWVKADGTTIDPDDYAIVLEVIEKTTYFDRGIYAIVTVK